MYNKMEKTQEYIQSNKDKFVRELTDLLRIPSVSADPAFAKDVLKTAESIANHLRAADA